MTLEGGKVRFLWSFCEPLRRQLKALLAVAFGVGEVLLLLLLVEQVRDPGCVVTLGEMVRKSGYDVVERLRRAFGETRSVQRGEDRQREDKDVAEFLRPSVLSHIAGAPETILHPFSPFDILGGRLPLGHRGRDGVDVLVLALRHGGVTRGGKCASFKKQRQR